MKILWNWKMVGRYEDGTEICVGGFDEEDCMSRLFDRMDEHGKLIWYSGLCDEDYEAGEYIGRDNFIW